MKTLRFPRFSRAAHAALFASVILLATSTATFAQIFVAMPGSGEFDGTIANYTAGGASTTFATGVSIPEGLAFWGSDLYVALNTNHGLDATIVKFAPNGSSTVFASSTGSPSTFGLAFDSAGNLYSAGNTSIMKYTPGGGGAPITFATPADQPYGLAIDSSGNVYAAMRNNNTISSYDSGGTLRWTVSLGAGHAPVGVAAGDLGLFVANHTTNTVDLYSFVDGSSLGNVANATDGLNGPFGLAFSGGLLYVANDGGVSGSIQMYSDPHTVVGSFATSSFPSFVTASAVPEPSTYAALAGLCVLGVAAWRRRTAT